MASIQNYLPEQTCARSEIILGFLPAFIRRILVDKKNSAKKVANEKKMVQSSKIEHCSITKSKFDTKYEDSRYSTQSCR
jgi:hypothetical protein